jgi:tRNA threonylcarbamoyladenosine biosynthesis protein TsaB
MTPSPDHPIRLLLAVDTSGKKGSMALAWVSDSTSELNVIETVPLTGGTFSAQLVPQIAALLGRHGFTKSELSGLAVVTGPGSFTGLRVGLAAIKALAEVLHKPIAAISLLEAVARSSGMNGHLYSALDAGRGDLYIGNYDLGEHVRMVGERLLSREEFFTGPKERMIVTPDPGLADAARQAGCRVHEVEYPRADVIARLGWERIRRGEAIGAEDLEANYIRRSDAEIFSKTRP